MIGKVCRAPSGGGSASGLVEYLVGYAVAEKGASRTEIRGALEAVYSEAEQRTDHGAGAIWSPAAGGGTRPSSILVRNCDSFATASLEMDSDALSNPGVRNGAMHFVWSFSERETTKLTDDQVHAYVGEVLKKLSLAEHRSVAVVHRDTDNIHVHIAVGSVHPESGLAYERTGLYRKMAWAEREVELTHGLEHDHGLAVVRDAGTEHARVDWADKHELVVWRALRREERLTRLERRSWEGYRERDTSLSRYADATVAPRMRAAIETAGERGREITWADLHAVAARYGTALEQRENGRVILRDVGIGEMRFKHAQEMADLRRDLKAQNLEPDEIDAKIAERKAEHLEAETAERERKANEGDTVVLEKVLPAARALPAFQNIEQSEQSIAERVKADPKIVLRDVTAQSSTFSREDVDLWLCNRISDPEEIERLGDLVMRDDTIRVLSADTPQALCTTTEVLEIEDRLTEDAQHLAHRDSGITHAQIDRAIKTYEQEQSEKLETSFRLNDEQRAALMQISDGSLLSVEGLPGVGKTTIMGVVRVLGEQTDREVVGLTLSQAAAERLESEAGFRAINTSRAGILEENGEQIIPQRGIVVVDEAAMMDSRANGRILQTARERGCIVQEIYDTRQLQPIDFGGSARIIRDAGKEAGTHAELREIQRQKNDWHKQAVATLADAIVEKDEAKRLEMIKSALHTLETNGAITWVKDRDEAIDKAVEIKRVRQAFHAGGDVRMIAADKDTVRHLAEEDRKREGLQGQGMRFVTDGGLRELAAGDSLIFLENSQSKRGLGILNGDRGRVVDVQHDRISVQMDDDRVVEFSPRSYRAWDHANATSVYKSQGASVEGCVSVIDRSASAELLFVAGSRSKHSVDLVVATSNFADIDDLAEHVANRISLKTTSRNYDEIVGRTGGKETIRVQNLEAQKEALNSPLRRKYDLECKEPAAQLRAERLRELRASYKAQKGTMAADGSLSLEARLAAQCEALSEFRSSAAQVYAQTQPQKYVDWVKTQDAAREKMREIERQRQRDERERERIGRLERAEQQREHEHERNHDHGR